MHLLHVVGARPNFMKASPVIAALNQYKQVRQTLVHTGQHYDTNMSEIFFNQLGLPKPDINLGVGSASHAVQTAEIMIRFEQVILEARPDIVLVYGDVNSTIAAALVCAKLMVPVAHVEAGLRSFDRKMPEEINRILTDRLATWLFTPSPDGNENLLAEGVAKEKIHFVGNVMIDTLVRLLPQIETNWPQVQEKLDVPERFGLVTLHRPSNVDDVSTLTDLLQALNEVGKDLPLILPIHPRTRQRIKEYGLLPLVSRIRLVEPLGYLSFIGLQRYATVVITDSGGIQEETTFLGVPCLTVRENTERPITVMEGTNMLIGYDMSLLKQQVDKILSGERKEGKIPDLWDGKAGTRIAQILVTGLG